MTEYKTLVSLLALVFAAAFGYADAISSGPLPTILFAVSMLLWAISRWDGKE